MIEHKRHDLGHRAWPGVWFGTVYGLAQFMVLYSLRFGTVYGLVRFIGWYWLLVGKVYGLWFGTFCDLVQGVVWYGFVKFIVWYGLLL